MRGEWVEIGLMVRRSLQSTSLPVRGEWVEITHHQKPPQKIRCLSPCGESGLKYQIGNGEPRADLSLPVRGEWVEISRLVTMRPLITGLSPCGESGLKCRDRCPV